MRCPKSLLRRATFALVVISIAPVALALRSQSKARVKPPHRTAGPRSIHKITHKPLALFGPSLPPERARAARQAQDLRDALQTGQLRLSNPERDAHQLFCVARDGLYIWPPESPEAKASSSFVPAMPSSRLPVRLASRHAPNRRSNPAIVPAEDAPLPPPPNPHLMQMLCVLAQKSTPEHPLEILSLFRPPYRTVYWQHGGPNTMHSHCMAVDIAAFGGHRIVQSQAEECVQMALALLRALPPGNYRLGLPKAPESLQIVGLPPLPPDCITLAPKIFAGQKAGASFHLKAAAYGALLGFEKPDAQKTWPFFPAQQPEIVAGSVAGQSGGKSAGRPHFIKFRNEDYAPLEAVADTRVRQAIAQARKRGVILLGLFPDAADHIHVDVKPKR